MTDKACDGMKTHWIDVKQVMGLFWVGRPDSVGSECRGRLVAGCSVPAAPHSATHHSLQDVSTPGPCSLLPLQVCHKVKTKLLYYLLKFAYDHKISTIKDKVLALRSCKQDDILFILHKKHMDIYHVTIHNNTNDCTVGLTFCRRVDCSALRSTRCIWLPPTSAWVWWFSSPHFQTHSHWWWGLCMACCHFCRR